MWSSASALGVLLGLVMGSVGWVRSVLEPWLTFLRALPPLAYFFLLVIWLGIDEAPKITLLALAALPPAAVATTAAVVAAPVGLKKPPALWAPPRAGHPRRRRPVRAAGDLHRHPAGGRHGLLVGGRRRTLQRHPRYRWIGQGRKQLQQHPRRAGRHLRHRILGSCHRRSASRRRAARRPLERKDYETQGRIGGRGARRRHWHWPAARSTAPASRPTSRRSASATRPSPAAT